jgi:hypothetical protein
MGVEKSIMKYFKLLAISSIVLPMSQSAMAENYTYLFNPATMEVGQSVGEYLEVKESCPDGGTSCTASSKLKYVTAIEGRTGRLEIPVSASNNFEISFNVRGKNCYVNHTYTLYMSDGNSLSLNVGSCATGVRGTGITGGGNINWLDGINDFRLIVKEGQLEISTNDDVDGETELSGTLTRIVISKINTGEEELFEIRTRGIQGGVSCPNSNSGTVLPILNSQLPTIAPNLNLHIPTIEYQSLGGNMNIWVDLQFTTTDDGKMWWVLDDSGVNP